MLQSLKVRAGSLAPTLLESCETQVRAVGEWFDALADVHRLLPHADEAANDSLIEEEPTDKLA